MLGTHEKQQTSDNIVNIKASTSGTQKRLGERDEKIFVKSSKSENNDIGEDSCRVTNPKTGSQVGKDVDYKDNGNYNNVEVGIMLLIIMTIMVMLQGRVDCTTMDWPSLVVSKTRTRCTQSNEISKKMTKEKLSKIRQKR